MDHHSDGKYEAFKLPKRSGKEENEKTDPEIRTSQASGGHPQDGMFYEIEYDASPWPGVGKYVLKPARIQQPPRDEIRERFSKMREFARENPFWYADGNRYYDGRTQRERGRLFYKQAVFMKDFEDDYGKSVPYSSYYPFYQMMGYEQLRTYFTWRTKVRRGLVEETSVSYAFLYVYELLNNIGVENPADGRDKLMFFWKKFREFDPVIDKYMIKWMKDYHIYYDLFPSFREFIIENGLEMYYQQILKSGDDFDQLCSLSKYDLRKSAFYTEDRAELIRNCFSYTEDRIRAAFRAAGLDYDKCIFPPVKNMTVWMPFQDALFFPWLEQPDRETVLGGDEFYLCVQNNWKHYKRLVLESGRKLLGYIMKQMESVLRKVTKYKYSITAGVSMLSSATVAVLTAKNLSLEKLIAESVKEFYREATKTVVRVNPAALDKIRREAMLTQDKLTVEEILPPERSRREKEDRLPERRPEEKENLLLERSYGEKETQPSERDPGEKEAQLPERGPGEKETQLLKRSSGDSGEKEAQPLGRDTEAKEDLASERSLGKKEFQLPERGAEEKESHPTEIRPEEKENPSPVTAGGVPGQAAAEAGTGTEQADVWSELRSVLSSVELGALEVILHGAENLKQYADGQGIMLEVLADGINEKAMDLIGDSILDDEFAVYEDYAEQVKEMVRK